MKSSFLDKMTSDVGEEELAVFQKVVDKMAENIGIRTERLC